VDKSDPRGEWVISGQKSGQEQNSSPVDEELLAAAREAWPHVLAHARRKLADNALAEDKTALAADVWEGVLRSVSKTLQRRQDHQPPIADLQSYLIGAFHHRFNRVLKREQKRQQMIQLVPSTLDLDRLKSTRDFDWVSELERAITIREIIEHMDDWTRRVWKARQYGYSWKEIANHLGLNEQQAKMRFRYGLEKTRDNLFNLLRRQRPNPPSQK
jgi:DNA-directed RNA polymerase specialized sigma24 family protein